MVSGDVTVVPVAMMYCLSRFYFLQGQHNTFDVGASKKIINWSWRESCSAKRFVKMSVCWKMRTLSLLIEHWKVGRVGNGDWYTLGQAEKGEAATSAWETKQFCNKLTCKMMHEHLKKGKVYSVYQLPLHEFVYITAFIKICIVRIVTQL